MSCAVVVAVIACDGDVVSAVLTICSRSCSLRLWFLMLLCSLPSHQPKKIIAFVICARVSCPASAIVFQSQCSSVSHSSTDRPILVHMTCPHATPPSPYRTVPSNLQSLRPPKRGARVYRLRLDRTSAGGRHATYSVLSVTASDAACRH